MPPHRMQIIVNKDAGIIYHPEKRSGYEESID